MPNPYQKTKIPPLYQLDHFVSKNQKVTPTCDKKTKKITTENQEALS